MADAIASFFITIFGACCIKVLVRKLYAVIKEREKSI